MTEQTDPAALVKPLVWTDGAFVVAFGVPEAEGIFLKYYIDKETKGYSLSLCSELIGKYKTIKAAKAAAQADHEARILSALTVIDAKALVKAALREAAELVAGHSEFVRSLDCSRHLQKRSEGDRLGLAYVEAILALIEEDKTDD